MTRPFIPASECAPDDKEHFLELHRLVEARAILAGDAPEGIRRDIAREDGSRKVRTKDRAQRRYRRQPIHSERQVEVGDDKVRAETARCNRQGSRPIGSTLQRVAFRFEERDQKLPHIAVVIDHQDGAGIRRAGTRIPTAGRATSSAGSFGFSGDENLDRKDGALSNGGPDLNLMSHQPCKPLNDGQAKTQTPAWIARVLSS